MIKYYRLIGDYKGHHYFKVDHHNMDNPVIKVTFGTQPKRGRPYCPGITMIKYTSFIGNYGWNMENRKDIKEITKTEYDKAFDGLLKKLK